MGLVLDVPTNVWCAEKVTTVATVEKRKEHLRVYFVRKLHPNGRLL